MHDVARLVFNERLVLAHRRRPAVLVLNEMAGFVWDALEAGNSPEIIAAALSQRYGMPAARSSSDVEDIMVAWRSAGLFDAPRPSDEHEPLASATLPLASPISARTYALCGRPIRFEFSDFELERAVHRLFAPAEVEGKRAPHTIGMYLSAGRHCVGLDDHQIEPCADLDTALGLAINHVLDLSYPTARWLALLHAGAVADASGGAILLPGIGGSGKSTLTAALVRAGLAYLSDDIVPLDGGDMRVWPAPFALCLKEGSWAALRSAYPGLGSLPVHHDADRRRRYLDLSRAQAPFAGHRPEAIIFPEYARRRQPRVTRLEPLETLQRLVEARCWMSLERADLERFFGWLERIPSFAVGYRALDAAVQACLDLMGRSRSSPS